MKEAQITIKPQWKQALKIYVLQTTDWQMVGAAEYKLESKFYK